MNHTTVTIYEFSKGINVSYNPDGSWQSAGFTGQYMNLTIDPISQAPDVHNAIVNDFFEVKCATSNRQPAIVGRVINNWSVIGIFNLTSFGDDRGRPLTMVRYFLCHLTNGLGILVDYIEQIRNKQGSYPIFDPLDKKERPIEYRLNNDSPAQDYTNTPDKISKANLPVLFKYDPSHDLSEINNSAVTIAQKNNIPVSWASNVDYVNKPETFILINGADDHACAQIKTKIHKNRENQQRDQSINVNLSINEKEILNAIKNLMQGNTTQKYIKTIAIAITNGEMQEGDWYKLFNSQSANKATQDSQYKKFSSDNIGRLLTLRGMIVPRMLPELLKWLELEGHEEYWNTCLEFSSNFYRSQHLTNHRAKTIIFNNLTFGINLLPPKLFKQEIKPRSFAKLLTEQKSAWIGCQDNLIKTIGRHLDLIGNNKQNSDYQFTSKYDRNLWQKLSEEIWKKLRQDQQAKKILPWRNQNPQKTNTNYLDKNKVTMSEYQPFTDFFFELSNSSKVVSYDMQALYAYFAQVSQGCVPFSKPKFKQVFYGSATNKGRNFSYNLDYQIIYGLLVYRVISKPGQVVYWLGNLFKSPKTKPVWFYLLLSLFSIFVGIAIGEWGKPISSINNVNTQSTKFLDNTNLVPGVNQITPILNQPDLDADVTQDAKKRWIIAIYQYQDKLGKPDGIINTTNGEKIKYLTVDLLFEPTRQALEKLVSGVVQETNTDQGKVKRTLKQILGDGSIDYTTAIEGKNSSIEYRKEQQFALMKAINQYEQTNQTLLPDSADGIMAINDSTFNYLKKELISELKRSPSSADEKKPSS